MKRIVAIAENNRIRATPTRSSSRKDGRRALDMVKDGARLV